MTTPTNNRVNTIATEIKDDVQHNNLNDLTRIVQGLDPRGDEFKAIQAALSEPSPNDKLPPLTLNVTPDGQTNVMSGDAAVLSERYAGKPLTVTGGRVTGVDTDGVIHTQDSDNVTRTYDPASGREVSTVHGKDGDQPLTITVRNSPGARPSEITYFPGTPDEQKVQFNSDGYAIPGHGLPDDARVDAAGVVRWDKDGNSFTQNPDGVRTSVPWERRDDPKTLTTYYGADHAPCRYSSDGENFEMHIESDGSKTWWYTQDSKPGEYIPVKPPVNIKGVMVGYTINQSFSQYFDYQVGGVVDAMRPA